MSDFDPADFVDSDFQTRKATGLTSTAAIAVTQRAPTREEVDSKVVEAQQKLAELKRAQEDLERERASLEETRRRQMEFHTGRQEMLQDLTRGIDLLAEAEFTARRDAEQMAKTLADFRAALSHISNVHEEAWTKDNFSIELTRALTAIENARMEWNAARLKFPVLSGQTETRAETVTASERFSLADCSFGQLCKIGLALTWPMVTVGLITLGVLLVMLFSR